MIWLVQVPSTWADVQALIGVASESDRLDLKRALPKQAHDFPKDIAAMTKIGGAIIYGVDEDKPTRVAAAITPVAINGAEERIRGATRAVDPRVDFEVTVLRPDPAAEKGVIVVVIPASSDWPHMVDGRYPVRDGTTTRYLTHAELRQALCGARKPQFSLAAITADGEYSTAVVAPPALQPWPIDVARIVSNELAAAEWSIEIPPSVVDTIASRRRSIFGQPTEADHERARQSFLDELPAYAETLHEWLAEYVTAAHARASTFSLNLALSNAAGGEHADDAELLVELPPTAETVDDLPTLAVPPARPRYRPPEPASLSSSRSWASRRAGIDVAALREMARLPAVSPPAWRRSRSGRSLEIAVGAVHASRSVVLAEPLLVRVSGPGEHVLRWTAYSKSLSEPATGTLTLTVPSAPDRPAFGRLAGILRYPDVPLLDEAGTVVHAARSDGPPVRRPTASDHDAAAPAAAARLRLMRIQQDWDALGLDPSNDGRGD